MMFRALGLSVLASSWAFAQPYGLTARPAFTAFNNNYLPSNAAPVSGTWSTTLAFPNLTFLNPMGVTPMPGTNNLVVWEREGRVYFFNKSASTSSKTLMIDLHNEVQGWDDSGLMGLAFHPQFATNRFVFLYYTYVTPGTVQGDMNNRPPTSLPNRDRLVRYTVNANGTINTASKTIFVDQLSNTVWHNGGGLFFHPDNGFLHWSNGDDASGGTQQTITNELHSGVFRIDVDKRGGSISHAPPRKPNPSGSVTQNYYIPNDNPFVGQPNALEEYFCLGLRSPHRMTIDHVSKRIFIGDVGQGDREEIDIIEPTESGLNFQWDAIEGLNGNLTAPYIGTDKPPVLDYPHSGEGAVIGGYVYRGAEFPELVGKYVFGDNISGNIYYLDETTTPATRVLLTQMPFGPGPNSGNNYVGLSSFGVDDSNELYLCQLSSTAGRIYKLSRSGPSARQMPLTLSETHVFSNLTTLAPGSGFIAYDVNTPLWSDGAHKQRWFAIPDGKTIGYAPSGEWTFPNGSVFVKHFDLPTDATNPSVLKRLETRVLVRDDTGYVYGGSYKWRADNSDADLVVDAETVDVSVVDASSTLGTQPWFFPGRQDCTTCHTRAAGGVLGIKTKQSHRDHDFSGTTDNQLRAWNHVGYFSPALDETTLATLTKLSPITDTGASVEHRVRSYLDSNCSHCHRPAGVHALWDARIDTPLDDAGIVNGIVGNELGVTDARVVTPQDAGKSIMHKRLSTATETYKMPPVAKNKVDADAVALLEQWIAVVTPPAPKPLPSPWKHTDIGGTAIAGTAAHVGGAFNLQGSGDDIWGTADGLQFMYQDLNGDGAIMARVTSQTNTDGWAKAGVMIRESLAAGSKQAITAITPGNGYAFQGRAATNGDSFYDGGNTAATPVWVRIQRKGSVFISAVSDDGNSWTEINRHTISMATKAKIGLAVTAHNNGVLSTVGFDNVQVMPSALFVINSQPQSTLVRAGNPAHLDVGTLGDPPTSYQWRRNGVGLKNSNAATYEINATTTAQGGAYSVAVGGKLTSNAATLAVVGEVTGNLNVVANGTATLMIPTGGGGVSFVWSKDAAPLMSSSKTSGTNTSKLTVKGFVAGDEGDYTCTASAFGYSEALGPYHLHLLKVPSLTNAAPTAGIVSGAFTWQLTSDEPATTFIVSTLPSGLNYDAKTNRITGTPNVAGDFTIKVTPTNAAGKGTAQTFALHIDAFPINLRGGYVGLIDRAPGVNDDLGGYLSISVTSTGGLSGRLSTAATSYPLGGRVLAATALDPTYSVTIARGTLAPLVVSLTLVRSNATITGTTSVGAASAVVSAYHVLPVPPGTPNTSSTMNVQLKLASGDIGASGKPQGAGWMRLTRSLTSGVTSVAAGGKLGDASPLTFSSNVTDHGMPLRAVLYGGHGSIQGTATDSASSVAIWPPVYLLAGALDWKKLAAANASDHSYATIAQTLTMDGMTHSQPLPGFTLLGNADAAGNAKLDFAEGGIATAAQSADVNQTFQLTAKHKAIFGNAAINPCGVALMLDAAKGTFSGSFKLKDAATTRTVMYEGILVNNVGEGFFTLPELPLTSASPVRSGKVHLQASP